MESYGLGYYRPISIGYQEQQKSQGVHKQLGWGKNLKHEGCCWERNKIFYENKGSPTTKEVLSSTWNSCSVRSSQWEDSKYIYQHRKIIFRWKNIFLFSLGVRSLVMTYSCGIATEADHRPLGYMLDKSLVSTWPRLLYFTFKLWGCLLKSTIQAWKNNSFRRFFLTAIVLGSRLQRGKEEFKNIVAALTINRKWRCNQSFGRWNNVKRVCTRVSFFCFGEKIKWIVQSVAVKLKESVARARKSTPSKSLHIALYDWEAYSPS